MAILTAAGPALALLAAVATKQSPVQTIEDAKTLLGVYRESEAKTLDWVALGKSGALKTIVAAAHRTTGLADELMSNEKSAQDISELLATIG